MDKLDKIFEENPEWQDKADELLYNIMPSIIETLLLSKKIDRTRVEDPEYIWSVIIENIDVVHALTHSKRIDDQLLETARDAVKADKIPVAIILIATNIEHIVNIFYRDILEKHFDLPSKETTEAIRSNFRAKLGWLLRLVTQKELPDDLNKRVRQIIEFRNAFVHYKAINVSLNEPDTIEKLIEQIKGIGIEKILNTPEELEKELFERFESMYNEHKVAQQITETMIRYKEQKLVAK